MAKSQDERIGTRYRDRHLVSAPDHSGPRPPTFAAKQLAAGADHGEPRQGAPTKAAWVERYRQEQRTKKEAGLGKSRDDRKGKATPSIYAREARDRHLAETKELLRTQKEENRAMHLRHEDELSQIHRIHREKLGRGPIPRERM